MIPYNYRSYYPGRSELQNIGWAKIPSNNPLGASPVEPQAQTQGQQPHKIQVNSTIDADIVLRRVIEDRAAILALKGRAAVNEAELMKAKTRQLHITKILERQDQEIAKLTIKAKHELAEYNEKSKQYIRSFMFAFEHGDIDKLPRHPFVPSLEELEQAINQRKATLIEKVQADDRVKKLEFINSREKVTSKVSKKNEEAFLRAVELSKQKFGESCGAWLNRVNKLLSSMPQHAQTFGDVKKVQSPGVQMPENSTKYAPLINSDVLLPQYPSYNSQILAQDLNLSQEKNFLLSHMPAKKRPLGLVHPLCTDLLGNNFAFLHPMLVKDESTGNKKMKVEDVPTPPSCSAIVSHSEDYDMHQEKETDNKGNENGSTQPIDDHMDNEEMSIAQVLTSLHGDTFAVSNI